MRYLRDKDGRVVDFAIIRNRKVEELIEVKYSDTEVSSSFLYFIDKLKPKRATQIVATLKKPFKSGSVLVTNPVQYFGGVDLP